MTNTFFNMLRRIWIFSNWFSMMRVYRGKISPDSATINTRSGLKITIKKVIDVYFIDETFTWKVYSKPPFNIPRSGIVVDVGANIGIFSLYAASKGNKVYSFEPIEDNYDLLMKNIRQNKLDNMIIINKKAIAASVGVRTIHLNPINPGAHSFYGDGTAVNVECTTLPTFFAENKIDHCDFLKMDCEGAEFEILEGLDSNFFEKFNNICLEYHDAIKVTNLVERLTNEGFDVHLDTKFSTIRAKRK